MDSLASILILVFALPSVFGKATVFDNTPLLSVENEVTSVNNEISLNMFSPAVFNESTCETIDYECKCCSNYTLEEIGPVSLCLSLKYLSEEYGMEVKLTLNNFEIIDNKVSLRNPPPVCVDQVPYLEKLAQICVRFYNMTYSETELDGCAEVRGSLVRIIKVFKYQLGCFRIPFVYGDQKVKSLHEVILIHPD